MRMHSKALLSAVLLGMVAATVTRAQERNLGGIGITVFEDADFRGRNATFREEVSDLSAYHLNDRVSSFRIARGESWEVCEHKDFRGRCAVFSGDEPDLRRASWNDTITSLRPVRRERPRWEDRDRDRPSRSSLVLYDQKNFRGEARELDRPESDMFDFGRRVSSVNTRGRPWEICDRPNFGGRCVVVSGEVPDLRSYGMENRIASARPVRSDSGDRGERRDEPRLILYERPDYRGRSREVNDAESEISDFNDRAQSARVVGAWQICEHRDFRGRCVTLTGDVPDLDTYRLRNAVTSARPVNGPPR